MIGERTVFLPSGSFRTTVPVHYPTGDTHCYLAPDNEGWTVIDVGVRSPDAEAAWEQALNEIGIGFQDIHTIVATHHHPDHCGGAGWLQRKTKARVYMSPRAIEAMKQYTLPAEEQKRLLEKAMLPHGISPKIVNLLVRDSAEMAASMEPLPEVEPLPPGGSFRLGEDHFSACELAGHCDGHIVLFSASSRKVLTGDLLLADRVSQVSDWPYSSRTDPLPRHIRDLRRLAGFGATEVLVSHGPDLNNSAERVAQVEMVHLRRINKILEVLQGEMTLGELCARLGVAARIPQEFRVSWADTLAYLEYLVSLGMVIRKEGIPIQFARGKGIEPLTGITLSF